MFVETNNQTRKIGIIAGVAIGALLFLCVGIGAVVTVLGINPFEDCDTTVAVWMKEADSAMDFAEKGNQSIIDTMPTTDASQARVFYAKARNKLESVGEPTCSEPATAAHRKYLKIVDILYEVSYAVEAADYEGANVKLQQTIDLNINANADRAEIP